MLLNADFAPLVPFERPTEDADGNAVWTPLADYQAAVDFSGPGIESGSGRQDAQSGTVFVPRGSDLEIGDRFTWGTGKFMLSGGPNGDMDHPMTGDDFGWVSYSIVGQLARWGRGK